VTKSDATIERLRAEYSKNNLREADVDSDPIRQFERWFGEACRCEVAEPHIMTLATATPDGRPSARMVLLRGISERGFTFFTNYNSRKARELEANPYAALTSFWREVERQVRIEGKVERVSDQESDRYFHTRPRGARIGAWASPQSEVITGRNDLDLWAREFETRFGDGEVPRPPNWGGYRLVPESIELWQGRPNRLHDRLRYSRRPEGGWLIERLAP
jgi:pyridoxamine 5'-phosphate oxidase